MVVSNSTFLEKEGVGEKRRRVQETRRHVLEVGLVVGDVGHGVEGGKEGLVVPFARAGLAVQETCPLESALFVLVEEEERGRKVMRGWVLLERTRAER